MQAGARRWSGLQCSTPRSVLGVVGLGCLCTVCTTDSSCCDILILQSASGVAASGRRLFLFRAFGASETGAWLFYQGLLVRTGNAGIENIVDSSVRADQGLIPFPGQA